MASAWRPSAAAMNVWHLAPAIRGEPSRQRCVSGLTRGSAGPGHRARVSAGAQLHPGQHHTPPQHSLTAHPATTCILCSGGSVSGAAAPVPLSRRSQTAAHPVQRMRAPTGADGKALLIGARARGVEWLRGPRLPASSSSPCTTIQPTFGQHSCRSTGYVVNSVADVEVLTAMRAIHRGRTFADVTGASSSARGLPRRSPSAAGWRKLLSRRESDSGCWRKAIPIRRSPTRWP